jgi:hypothetical protein
MTPRTLSLSRPSPARVAFASPAALPTRVRPVFGRLGWAGCALLLLASASLAADAAPKEVTFNDIKLDLKKDDPWKPSLLTEGVKKLDGKQVRIRGYILPPFQQSGIKQFVLMRDNQECCFGPGSVLHDRILVEMVGDATADYTVRAVTISGQFAVREEIGPDGETMAIYHLDCKEVK